jgi:hypothetical protein
MTSIFDQIDEAHNAYIRRHSAAQRFSDDVDPADPSRCGACPPCTSDMARIVHDADCVSFFAASPGPCDCSASRKGQANG